MTEASGLGFAGFCHGVVVGDIDNDGDQDVFLCNYGPNVLYLNNGDGTFTDISKAAGIDAPELVVRRARSSTTTTTATSTSTSPTTASWKLPEDDKFCGDADEEDPAATARPETIRTVKHLLLPQQRRPHLHRRLRPGDPHHRPRDQGSSKPRTDGHGFGVVTADLNGDGKIDLYVANDMNPNFLFLNKGDGTFEDATESSGAAYDEKGQAQSGMGVDAEDVDGDGLPELFVTNFANEYNTLYQNLARGMFMDSTPFFGLAADTMPLVGWGTALVDFDNDGWPDNFVANGHVDDNRQQARPERSSTKSRPALPQRRQGQAVPPGDPRRRALLRHQARRPRRGVRRHRQRRRHRHRRQPQGRRPRPPAQRHPSRRQPLGPARASGHQEQPRRHRRPRSRSRPAAGRSTASARGACSMESANDPRLLIGVGRRARSTSHVRWPSGSREHAGKRQDRPDLQGRRAGETGGVKSPQGDELDVSGSWARPAHACGPLLARPASVAAVRCGRRRGPIPTRSGNRPRHDLQSAQYRPRRGGAQHGSARLRPPTPLDWMLRPQSPSARDRGTRPSRPCEVPDDHSMAAQARLIAGQVELRRGRAPGGRECCYEAAIRLDPKLVQAHKELIYIYGILLRRPELNAEFLALSKLAPMTFDNVCTGASTRNSAWEPGELTKQLEGYVKTDPDDRRLALWRWPRTSGQLDRRDEAAKVLDASATPTRTPAPCGFASPSTSATTRRPRPCSRRDRPTTPTWPGSAGKLALARRTVPAAVAAFRAAYKADPDHRDALFGLGQALAMTGETEAAAAVHRGGSRS